MFVAKKDFKRPGTPTGKSKIANSSSSSVTSAKPSSGKQQLVKRKLPDASPGLARKQLKPTNN